MTRSDAKMRDLISSLHSKSTALNKLLPVWLCGSTVIGLVDSGNSFYNAISLAVANKIGLSNFHHYTGPPVATALVGSTLDIVGIINITLGHIDESGRQHSISSRLVIVRHLSCGLNISLQFMVQNGISQLHPNGVLLWSNKNIRFPLCRNMRHARKIHQWKNDPPKLAPYILISLHKWKNDPQKLGPYISMSLQKWKMTHPNWHLIFQCHYINGKMT